MRILASLSFAALMLVGCSSLLPKAPPSPSLYTLNPPAVTVAEKAMAHNLQIRLPQVAPGLDSERIALRKNANQIDYYNEARWAGNLKSLVQALLVETFDNTHAFKSVDNDLVDMPENYALLTEIRDFQIEYNGTTPLAHIRIVAKVIRNEGNVILHTYEYNESKAASTDTMQAIMAAFDTAYQNVASQMADDVVTTLKSTKATKNK